MTDHRLEGPGENGDPVPRDMPDQQAGTGDDPWEAAAPTRDQLEQGQRPEGAEEADDDAGTGDGTDVPDTDEAGTGRQGAPHSGAVHPEHPVPDESSG
ncbi:hypothetical protein ACFFKE_25865 [Streptomyces mutabilis]|uniref:Uncharacterized protein n=1 Tax=Streptomyces mutabilis TaxID=67332 RepID=A0A086MSE1_9ACTN|nr:hypothetical protein [Streptomyces mutabilis]KFG71809.1 hypothetical protein FM21_31995 [Streptomyces mutabilis]GGQ12675.1 hypothetical protein GCM10010279_20380 [Streptomyces mutabilis]